jgi:hypothetical protein
MEQSIPDNGHKTDKDKAKELKSGKMAANIQVFGLMIWPICMEDLYIRMVMFMKANGLMIKLMEMEPTSTWTEQNIQEIGSKIDNTDSE